MGEPSTCPTCGIELPSGANLMQCPECARPDRVRKGETLADHYDSGREIARGGMGAVLDTRDRKFNRSVAMKVMLEPYPGESERRRFLQEARVLVHRP